MEKLAETNFKFKSKINSHFSNKYILIHYYVEKYQKRLEKYFNKFKTATNKPFLSSQLKFSQEKENAN